MMLPVPGWGRAPLICPPAPQGPMVYGICYCPVSRLEELQALKVAGNSGVTPRSPLPRGLVGEGLGVSAGLWG